MRNFILVSIVFIISVSVSFAAPKPAIVPVPGDWTVDVKFEGLQQIALKVDNGIAPRRFWYIILKLTNHTSRDVDFYPSCELMTDTFEVLPAGKSVPQSVFKQIKQRHQSQYPFLELWEKSSNRILQGQDNIKDIAIIWPDFKVNAKKIKIFVSGLSNETTAIKHPTKKDKNGQPVNVFLRKTLELSYKVGGDPAFRSRSKLVFSGKHWVMR